MKCEGCDKNWPTFREKKVDWHKCGDGWAVECSGPLIEASGPPRRREVPEHRMSMDEKMARRRDREMAFKRRALLPG